MLLTAKASCSFMFCGTIIYLCNRNNTTYDYSMISEFIEQRYFLFVWLKNVFVWTEKQVSKTEVIVFQLLDLETITVMATKVWYRFRCWLEREDWKFPIMLCSDKMVGSKSIYMQQRLKKNQIELWLKWNTTVDYIYIFNSDS